MVFMENKKTYIIQEDKTLGAAPVQLVSANLSRHSVIIVNRSTQTVNFGTMGRVSAVVGAELAPGQTVTITQQYDGDFARIDLVGIAGAEDSPVTVYQVMTYGGTE